ncbi:hypothetical protein DNTS_018940 [Danionella cerebrum]|uniref:Glypican-6 n=1 Tax=Danionella cerebrum TaxID=2873325 RepID=A0A553RAF7_9TELE|nr:hypothetical protein DNTS_018940 [Danionella translucida]
MQCALAVTSALNCSQIRNAFTGRGLGAPEPTGEEATGTFLQVCGAQESCCSPAMEDELVQRSSRDLEKIMEDATEELRDTFTSHQKRFEDLLQSLLDVSERSLNEMFLRTYGKPYVQNADLFQRLFLDLRGHLKGVDSNLEDILHEFWTRLLERMFTLLNSEIQITDEYLECLGKHMEMLQPFGDVPKKLQMQVMRAFLGARSFVQGLAVARDVSDKVSKVSMSSVCVHGFTKMLYCSYCTGIFSLKPCESICLTVMKSCLADFGLLDKEWTRFTDAMLLVTERLQGPFNIESVMEPIDVKISEAIMNLQENSMHISYQVFQGCGQPKSSGSPRSVRGTPDLFSGGRFRPYEELPTSPAPHPLQSLVEEVREKLQRFRGFFESMSLRFCQEEIETSASDQNVLESQEDKHQKVNSDSTRSNAVIGQQILILRVMSNRLKNAYQGNDVDFLDNNEGGSASGSGSGCMEACDTDTHSSITETPALGSNTVSSSASASHNHMMHALTLLMMMVMWVHHWR